MVFTRDELKRRAFERAALALFSFWEEQKDNLPRSAAVHSRIFETLIYKEYIELNKKAPDRKYPEHVVPCAYIRNHAFNMFWEGKTTDEVADMIGRLLRIAYIKNDEAIWAMFHFPIFLITFQNFLTYILSLTASNLRFP